MNIKLYIVGSNNDDKGTQLEELTTTILEKQGYVNVSTNTIYSGGSEIDAIAVHKNNLGVTEVEYPVICECKAHNKPVNMNDWLKFIGKIYIERFKNPQTIGLMIALSGANGNVIGSYNELKKQQFVHLIANDDLVTLLMSEYKLSSPNDIETSISQYTNKYIAEIGLVYYAKCVYWIVNFIDGGFTLLNHSTETLSKKELDNVLQLLYSNTAFTGYIDIKAEYAAVIRRASIDKLALSILMDEIKALPFQELLAKTQAILTDSNDAINQNEFSVILAENRFIQNKVNRYSLLPIDEINFIEFYRYVFTNATPIRILSRKLYLKMINKQLLEKICEIQYCIKIPDEKINECLFILKYSPTALSYAIEEDKAITRYRFPNGNTITTNVDKGHTEWFMHKITNSFIQDYHNQIFHELYLNEYKITSICINLDLEIAQEKKNKVVINDRKELLLSRLGEEYNNGVVLLSKLPEN